MASLVSAAIAERRHVIVEAGTGVGKSLAYLVPAVLAATADQQETAGREKLFRRKHPGSVAAAWPRLDERRGFCRPRCHRSDRRR